MNIEKDDIAEAMSKLEAEAPTETGVAMKALDALHTMLKSLGRGAPAPAPQGDGEDDEDDQGTDDNSDAGADASGDDSDDEDDQDQEDQEPDDQESDAPPPPPARPGRGGMARKSKAAAEATDRLHKSWVENDDDGEFSEMVDGSKALEYLADQVGIGMGAHEARIERFEKSQARVNRAIVLGLTGLMEEMAALKAVLVTTPGDVPDAGTTSTVRSLAKAKPADAQVSTLTKSKVEKVIYAALEDDKYASDKYALLNSLSALDVTKNTPDQIARTLPGALQTQLGL